jgi:hypothetical protein
MNHSGRLIDKLPADQRSKAIADLLRWAGVEQTARVLQSTPSDATDPMLLQRPPL